MALRAPRRRPADEQGNPQSPSQEHAAVPTPTHTTLRYIALRLKSHGLRRPLTRRSESHRAGEQRMKGAWIAGGSGSALANHSPPGIRSLRTSSKAWHLTRVAVRHWTWVAAGVGLEPRAVPCDHLTPQQVRGKSLDSAFMFTAYQYQPHGLDSLLASSNTSASSRSYVASAKTGQASLPKRKRNTYTARWHSRTALHPPSSVPQDTNSISDHRAGDVADRCDEVDCSLRISSA